MPKYTGPHDYFDENYVQEWAREANAKRPWREDIFASIISEIGRLAPAGVLDLGSGPGLLAERLLKQCDIKAYHLFDFSPLMLEMSRARLARFADRTFFHQGSFLEQGWWRALPAPFDAIVSLQAVHEVRDPARIAKLYSELKGLVKVGGIVLIADKVNNEFDKEEHHLTANEHAAALLECGFEAVRIALEAGDLALCYGKRP
jgi:SAM-dependent methyltransferase